MLSESNRALIVEDDPVVARSIARRLLREGYSVSMAQTCRAARAAGTGFQVAVLDLDLPDGTGDALADDLLRLGAVRHIVFYTGSIDPQVRENASHFGTVIDKTEDVEQVVQALEPFPTAPPVSMMAPAQRPRPGSSSRLSRAAGDEDSSLESLAKQVANQGANQVSRR
jgi:CheY-like chemotaxis protein